jgi:outer membrane receptor protein involved in Fe transport
MKRARVLAILAGAASPLAFTIASPAAAQSVPDPAPQSGEISTPAGAEDSGDAQSGTTDAAQPGAADDDIIVTAQRRAETLQSVPIAVSAFTGEALERQQIENALDLQLSLPNVTFTKTNFTSSSFTIRGIGDLCTGFACDQATGIHVNDMPLLSTRLFETEYFDLERVEVLRGPQGTLFGRNATSGVVNFITARPDLNEFGASAGIEFGNYDSIKLNGMINLPVSDMIGIRLAGYYLNREGYTRNLFDGSRIDGRDLYALRGTIRFQPTESTMLDIIGYYFREKDDRSRIQKQLCARDNTGVLGCRPDQLGFDVTNGASTLGGIVSSRELFALQSGGALTNFGLSSVYGPDAFFGGQTVPTGLRTVNIDFNPTYFAEEYHIMGKLEQAIGDQLSLNVTGGYANNTVDSRTDFNLAAGNSLANNPGLLLLAGASQLPGSPFVRVRNAVIPNGPGGGVCTSETNGFLTGIYGGFVNRCTPGSTDYDRSTSKYRQWVLEAHLDSDFDGPFNFLLGGIYVDSRFRDGDYYVASFGLDYGAGILGAASSGGAAFLAPPFFRNNNDLFTLKSYGLFGEAYFDISDRLSVTGGLRYSNDRKFVRARSPLLSFAVPYGLTDANESPFLAGYDADASTPGIQAFAEDRAKFDEVTGRFVVDFELTRDNLLYASYSRGYKSGGINPPIDPIFNVPRSFAPEIINAFEIGAKNTFAGGVLRLNLSAFYYDYKDLQLSRIVARTSVNDNTDAEIYGVEAEAVLRPTPDLLINLGASYLKSKIKDLALVDPRDVSGGRSDTVIIKDLTNASNCAVQPTGPGGAASSNGFVGAVNAALGLRPATAVPGTNTTGAYSVCGILQAAAAGNIGAANPALAPLQALLNFNFNGGQAGALPFIVNDGVLVDVSGNELPNAPNVKFSAGAQYTFRFASGMTLVPRADFTYTGEQFSRSFNTSVDRISGFEQVNAQIQLNAADERWFVRAFVQNLFDSNSITGKYVTDQSAGLFTNIFTLEPRRYGIAAGVKF